jgi:uncharacterized protein YjgD (DUF1641 family)
MENNLSNIKEETLKKVAKQQAQIDVLLEIMHKMRDVTSFDVCLQKMESLNTSNVELLKSIK